MAGLLTGLFAILVTLGVFFVFPVGNSVTYRGRPWATWGIIGANVVLWAITSLADLFGGPYGWAGLADQLVFADDFSRPSRLLTSLFVHSNPVQMFVLLWMLNLVAPVLEKRLKPPAFLALYLGGGVAATALYGSLARALGVRIFASGMAPGLFALLGLYLVLHPFDEFRFYYNALFFAFRGTVNLATVYMVPFAILLHVVSGQILGGMVLGILPPTEEATAWLGQTAPLLALCLGFLVGTLQYGLGAFVGLAPTGETRPPADTMVERALARLASEEERPSSRRITRRERAQGRLALADDAPPEEIEAFAEQCLANQRDPLLAVAYSRFRGRFPDRSFGPGLLAAVARRFEEADRHDLAVDAYRLLLRSHDEAPVAADGRFRLAKILARDPTATDEAIGVIEDLLGREPPREMAKEARLLLDRLIERSGRGDTYKGLSPYKPFRFGQSGVAPQPLETPAGVPSRPEGRPIGRSAEEIVGADEPTPSPTPTAPQAIVTAREIVPDSSEDTLHEWGFRPAEPHEVAAAMAATRTYAVILLPSKSLIVSEVLQILGDFWKVAPNEAIEQLRLCRGLLLDDAPSGRAVVLARKLRKLGLPVTVVPILPDITYARCEDVLELAWDDTTCSNVTATGRCSFAWDRIRMVNIGRVALPGAGQAFRLVLDLYVAESHCLLRVWENTVNLARSTLKGKVGAADSLQPLIEHLDQWAPRALKTPSFRAVAKKTAPPLDFHSPAELDHYNRWFLYAGFGKYSATE
jgi:membrane associated rhomboid family serine protease